MGWLMGLVLIGAMVMIPARRALASAPVASPPANVTTDANGDFCYYVPVTNNGHPGDVELHASGTANITGLTVTPDHHVFDSGETFNFKVCGHLNGPRGTVSYHLKYVDEDGVIHEQVLPVVPVPIIPGTVINHL
jgi:hypothetical protein